MMDYGLLSLKSVFWEAERQQAPLSVPCHFEKMQGTGNMKASRSIVSISQNVCINLGRYLNPKDGIFLPPCPSVIWIVIVSYSMSVYQHESNACLKIWAFEFSTFCG